MRTGEQAKVGAEPTNIANAQGVTQGRAKGSSPGWCTHYRREVGGAPPSVLTGTTRAAPMRPLFVSPNGLLFELDGGARFLELRLDLVGLLLGGALLDGVRRPVDEVLRLLQAEARDRADDLDHLDLLVAGVRQDDVERGLLLRCGGTVATGGS